MSRLWLVVFGLGCSMGANPDTLVDELRVVAMVAEPPEAMPGDPVDLTVYLANPLETEGRVGIWTCVGFGGVCLEQGVDRLGVVDGFADQMQWTITAPYEGLAVLEESDRAPVSVWSLACERELCPLLEDEAPCEEDLADPYTMMADLPMDGVSLARRSLWLTEAPEEERVQNPEIRADFSDDLVVEPEESTRLCFTVSGATDGYGYASAGGFAETEFMVEDGVLTLDYTAPAESLDVDLWVVVQTEEGGASVWTGTLSVAEEEDELTR